MSQRINSSSLENIKRQFDQDCLLTFGGYVYQCGLTSIEYVKAGTPVDKDGYPTPVKQSDLPKLANAMADGWQAARSSYIRRCSALEARSLTTEAVAQDERAE